MSQFASDSARWFPLLTLASYQKTASTALPKSGFVFLFSPYVFCFVVDSACSLPVISVSVNFGIKHYLCFWHILQESIELVGQSAFSKNCLIGHIHFVRLAHRLTLGWPLFPDPVICDQQSKIMWLQSLVTIYKKLVRREIWIEGLWSTENKSQCKVPNWVYLQC